MEALFAQGARAWIEGDDEPPVVAACRLAPRSKTVLVLQLLIERMRRSSAALPPRPLDVTNARGETALMHACARADAEAAALLLREGADPYAVDGAGYTAEHWARQARCTLRGGRLIALEELKAALQG
mmetsp:Transcript_42793/g.134250  ORF Transcript_42793/g.134250 Transcript_42793/m.134250 type:complete len:128 (-) Transcript_42793:449-832(-)